MDPEENSRTILFYFSLRNQGAGKMEISAAAGKRQEWRESGRERRRVERREGGRDVRREEGGKGRQVSLH